jgi:hypothetical protein
MNPVDKCGLLPTWKELLTLFHRKVELVRERLGQVSDSLISGPVDKAQQRVHHILKTGYRHVRSPSRIWPSSITRSCQAATSGQNLNRPLAGHHTKVSQIEHPPTVLQASSSQSSDSAPDTSPPATEPKVS